MLQVRVRKRPAKDYYLVEYRKAPWFFIWMHGWKPYDYYSTITKALSAAHELKNPTIVNITKEKP